MREPSNKANSADAKSARLISDVGLTNQMIAKVFISHSHSDIALARHVEKLMRAAGISCWFDESQIPVGERFVIEIGRAMRSSNIFLVIDSEPAAASYWVNREIQAAERLRSNENLSAIVVLSNSATHFLSCEPDAWIASPDLVSHTVASLASGTSPRVQRDDACLEAVRIIDHYDEDAVWLGFSHELEQLDHWWFGERPGMWVSGPGGSGKTSLVRTWIRAFQNIGYRELQSVRALFIYVDGRSGAHAILNEIAEVFSDSGLINAMSSKDEVAHRLECELRACRERGLLVINSPEKIDEIELLEVMNTAFRCALRVVVTSRDSLPIRLQLDFDTIALSQLSNRDASLLVKRLFSEQEADPMAMRLINALGGHPLAISLAMKQIEKTWPPTKRAQAVEDLLRRLTEAYVNGQSE